MPIGRPATVNTLCVPGGISATEATTYLCMARGLSHVLTPSPLFEHPGGDRVLALRVDASYATSDRADNLLQQPQPPKLLRGCRALGNHLHRRGFNRRRANCPLAPRVKHGSGWPVRLR